MDDPRAPSVPPRVSGRATEAIFLPGFDGAARLRDEFVSELGKRVPSRSIGYPNRNLHTLEGYWRHAASELAEGSRPVLIAESFSGLVAARWAASEPRIAGVVLCGAFARNPSRIAAALGAAWPSAAKFTGTRFMTPYLLARHEIRDAREKRWTRALPEALGELQPSVIGERLRLIARESTARDLSKLTIPIVLVHFEGDRIIHRGARRHLESVCHNAKVMRLPGPHFALETRPLQCAEAIADSIAHLFE